jgi:hypothetical protein
MSENQNTLQLALRGEDEFTSFDMALTKEESSRHIPGSVWGTQNTNPFARNA